MDNCDLDTLSISDGKLNPSFRSDITHYTATVESSVKITTLDLQTSDCGASYKILFGSGSRTVILEDGVNKIEIEVVAEDGTLKTYRIEVTKLSASTSHLSGLTIKRASELLPAFSSNTYHYSCTVSFDCCEVRVHPQTPDRSMQAVVNDSCSQTVILNVGETGVLIRVTSADGANLQVYSLVISREHVPLAVAFCDMSDQTEFECPVSLSALYKPVSIHKSEPKKIFSATYIDMLTRRSKVDPFTERPLGEGWKVTESELDRRMSSAPVKCFFSHRGCGKQMRFTEIGEHAKTCHHKPSSDLQSMEVMETNWYKKRFASSSNQEIMTNHSLELRNWEKRLQTAVVCDVDHLIAEAEEQLNLYKEQLPKPGETMQFAAGQSPLNYLEQAAIRFATAIKLQLHNAKLHLLLGQTLEEHYYATEMYGLKKKQAEEVDQDLGQAKSAGRQEEILAICRIHGFPAIPTRENQLKALDMELQDLKQQGRSAKADYVQSLFLWLSKKAGKDSSCVVSDEQHWLHRALLKYLDAWSLNAESWECNLHVGRLLLLQGKNKEALQHLQTALALRPCQPMIRFYTGLALLQEKEAAEQEVILFLQQGLEYIMGWFLTSHDHQERRRWNTDHHLSLVNAQFLQGCLSLGALLFKHSSIEQAMSAEQVYHITASLAAHGISMCVHRGKVMQQLEWILLEAHFVLLQALTIHEREDKHAWIAKRCQVITALIRLSSIDPCRELLDMQEKVSQIGVVANPRCSQALCLLGLAQLAQSDSDTDTERARVALENARLSFQASIALEESHQTGEPPEQLTKQMWWKYHLVPEKGKPVMNVGIESKPTAESGKANEAGIKTLKGRITQIRAISASTAKTPAVVRADKATTAAKQAPRPTRGRTGGATKSNRVEKTPTKPSTRTHLSLCKSVVKCDLLDDKPTALAVEAGQKNSGDTVLRALNEKSHLSRLGLARVMARTSDSQQACTYYNEVIDMSPEVHDAYIELADLLLKDDPLDALGVYCRFPLKPVCEQTFDDAFITGEIVHILMKHKLYEHPQLAPNLIAHGKVMGLGSLEKYIDALEEKFMTKLLRTVYAGIHDKSVDDEELQDFFKFKCWI